MSYKFKTKDAPKSISFTVVLDARDPISVKKGGEIKLEGQRCEVATIRNIEIGNGLIKISGKCFTPNSRKGG